MSFEENACVSDILIFRICFLTLDLSECFERVEGRIKGPRKWHEAGGIC